VLFLEKEGFTQILEAARIAERYDLAIMSTKGMSVTASRTLVEDLCGKRGLKLLVLHEFDVSGFSIKQTLVTSNRRYSFRHAINFIDLGLKKRLTIAQETPKGQAWNEAKIRNLTGGDPITARYMRQDFFDFWPEFKLIIAGNHKPKLNMVDEAIRARLLLIPFLVTILKAERDPQVTAKLREEWPQILVWQIKGCLDWQSGGLRVPESVRDASADYFHEQDHVAHWLDERTERKAKAFTAAAALFADYEAWLFDLMGEDGEPGKQKAFTLALQERGLIYGPAARGRQRVKRSPGLQRFGAEAKGRTRRREQRGCRVLRRVSQASMT
jgi:hypothetical protein